jgi:hypothetical protein
MIEAIRQAVRLEKVGIKRLPKRARLTDRPVTRTVAGDSVNSDEILSIYRAAEDLLAQKSAGDDEIALLLKWARTQPQSSLAAELGYDLSNLGKLLSGRIRPKHVLTRLFESRARFLSLAPTDAEIRAC